MNIDLQGSLPHPTRLKRSHSVLSLVWILSAGTGLLSLVPGWSALRIVTGLTSFAFILGLSWVLSRREPYADDLPQPGYLLPERIRFAGAVGIVVIGAAILVAVGMMTGMAASLMLFSALAGLYISIAWRGRLTGRILILGGLAGLVSGFGILLLGNHDLSWAVFNLIVIPPAFTGGALLVDHTHLSSVRLVQGKISWVCKASYGEASWPCRPPC
jgi:hypothetical protein